MAQTYTLSRVKSFIARMQESREDAERSMGRVVADPAGYKPGSREYFQGKADMAEDLKSIAEMMFDIDKGGNESGKSG